MAENDFATNGNDGAAMVQNARWSFAQNGVWDTMTCMVMKQKHIGRYYRNQWLMPFIGFDWRYRKFRSTK
jgi:hypothetical protein